LRLALVVAAACGQAASPRVSNHTPEARDVCSDTTTQDKRVFAYTVSDDPNDTRPVDESFNETWARAQPRFAACGSPGARAAVSIRVARSGAVTELKTRGPDPRFDRCVCEVLLSSAFPPQGRPVFATLVVRVP